MTRALVFFSLIFLSACASSRAVDKKNSFTFDAVKQVLANSLSQKQILEKYGEPDVKEREANQERWRYLDPATQYDRVQFLFNDSKKLLQMFWLPLPGEKEMRIEPILARYPKGSIKPTAKRRVSPHDFGTETTYSDGATIAILNDDAAKEVQAVVWFTPPPKSADTRNPMTSR